MGKLKLPLKQRILLITTEGKYICRIIYAGDDYVTAVDVNERIGLLDGIVLYTDMELGGKMIFSRDHIVGYKLLEDYEPVLEGEDAFDEETLKKYEANLVEYRRKNFRLIKFIPRENVILGKEGGLNDEDN